MHTLDKVFFVDAETKSQCAEDVLRDPPAFAVEGGRELTEARKEVLRKPSVWLSGIFFTSCVERFLVWRSRFCYKPCLSNERGV